ncbi:dihydrodipicolinate synthase family protein [Ancylobacter oerskovii]|uniref:Dihydrodipicolinate synthase family protein n=1 Tax=Ancylobacter oerskovii TaxID=459519 RepID=A0ABW4Z1S3_9HYPH|nr:dihydrodipicolinate synthase family protein [Ancylobacter oerskovii]MBS7545016.1 dihydrodipicolinate synthase family protein [Ancylobacter oerskovii]
MLRGILVPLVTPFLGAAVDEDAYAGHIERLLAAGVGGLVVGGIIGEGPTLAPAELERLTRVAVATANGRAPVIVATGTNGTASTIRATLAAGEAGAAAALLVVPYYNKPSQEGLFRHVEAVAAACPLPLVLHNVPQRTQIGLAPETLKRLTGLPRIFALLDEDDSPSRSNALAQACAGLRRIAPSGQTAWPPGLPAPHACLAPLANIDPQLCAHQWERRCAGRIEEEARLAVPLIRLQAALDLAPEPVGLKYAVSLMNPAFSHLPRLPLTEPEPAATAGMRVALAGLASAHESRHCEFM